jgi:pimeloyl-ACP methyl ester carboxylesterase
LTARLVEAGFKVILIQPRGIGKSTGDLTPTNVDMKLLADDIKATLDSMNIKKLHVAGHAFGNRLARVFATVYPDYVDSVILLASGGNFEMEPKAENCLRGSINMKLPDDERLQNIQCAFFAQGNDASIWLQGWYPKLAAAQINAAITIDTDFYKAAGGKNILLIQATEDLIAPPELAGKALAAELGAQLTYAEVENAGHALTSEQPEIVAQIMIKYLAAPSR